MSERGVTMLGWNDYVGLTRCRAVPRSRYDAVRANGLGWPVAGQSLTPFPEIAPNPWGPMTEVRQVPDDATRTVVDIWPGEPVFDLVLCDSLNPDGSAWECCTRSFYRAALEALHAETGLGFAAAFEHEFSMTGDLPEAPAFSVEGLRLAARLADDIADALERAGLGPETIEPEYGLRQYEVTVGHTSGISAGDNAILTRELIRECARRLGLRASFTPKPEVDAVGNGAHVHFSFVGADGQNATYDPDHPSGASAVTRSFIGGVVKYMPAICALVAPSPASYLRLGPQHWSCGWAAFGIQNREAAIRIVPSNLTDPQARARAFNLELRPPDGSASPYLVLGALVRAGVAGIKEGLELPPACPVDPAELDDAGRAELGIVALPSDLDQALDLMLASDEVRSWFAPVLLESYVQVKRTEQELVRDVAPEEIARRYRDAY